jgi:hypothetical protein
MTEVHTQSTSELNMTGHTPCPVCNAPLAPDQRYCLSCGTRHGEPRVDFAELLGGSGGGHKQTPGGAGAEPPPRDWTPVLALGGLAGLALVLVVGVLIGRGSQNAPKVASGPQVITVQGGGSGTGTGAPSGTNASATSITEDWPSGQSGYTVQLQSVTKAGATSDSVNAAKSAATGKGAPSVGVLDAANYKSLGSDYVIYSGVYTSQAKAQAELAKVKKSFPTAKVIHVVPSGGSASAAANTGSPVSAAQQAAGANTINQLSNCTGAACSKAARKITQPIATPGTPPPADNKPAGGGGAAQNIN